MFINSISTTKTNFYNNTYKTNKTIAFKSSNNDTFEKKYIDCLKNIMQENPKLYLKEIKYDQFDLYDSFYTALQLRKENNQNKIIEKIGKTITQKINFNPNHISENGQSWIDIALENKDEKMALFLMKNKKFKKPERFDSEESQKLYEDLEKKVQKKGLFSFLGF